MAQDVQNIRRPQRWDVPFSEERCESGTVEPMTDAEVERMLTLPFFNRMDPDNFAEHVPLRGLVQNDTRIRRFSKGNMVVRQGDYGNSAFLVISGSVSVVLDPVEESLMGRRERKRSGIFSALAQLWSNPETDEARSHNAAFGRIGDLENSKGDGTSIFLQDITSVLVGRRTARLPAGELFGEIAALGRIPRTSTVVARDDCELLEIRWQGLREFRARSPQLKEYVDKLYRERSLKNHLRETPMFSRLSNDDLACVARDTEFLTFGSFDWHSSYKKLTEMNPAERLQYEPVVAREGHYPNGVYLVRSGFARLSEAYNHGERTVAYLGRGQVFGFEEVAWNWRQKSGRPFQRTLRAVGYIDVLFVPTAVLEQYVLPTLAEHDFPPLPERRAGLAPGARDEADEPDAIAPELLEFLVERRFINGAAAMLVNLDRCTRCDDCVRACAATHHNNPRFVRNGPAQGGLMVAQACMHCQDPVCMIGCPTGAIHRDTVGGQVVINDLTCIGCATCANSCPYDNIKMVFARDGDGNPYLDEGTGQPIAKATKCDLCVDQITGPACAHACPHDALIRVDMRDAKTLSRWVNR